MDPPRAKIDIPFGNDADVAELVRQFESCELPYERWTHRAHFAVAASYLQRYSFNDALERVRVFIPNYNRVRGDPNGYHETITVLFMRLVEREMRVVPAAGLFTLVNELAERYPISWLLRYYSPDLLWSAAARTEFVPPDLQPIDW